jgi:predicted metal-dependent hydrolase
VVEVREASPGEGDESMPVLSVSGHFEHAPRRLENWLRKRAAEAIRARVDSHCESLGLSCRRIGVRDQKSRWGSCSSNGNLSFSWRLIMAPPHVLDYVAAHEVAHLREMNHSPRFWALVRRAVPEYEKAQGWLKANGQELHCYGASE